MVLAYNAGRRGPQTHVLIIGVGGYRHFRGHPRGPIITDRLAFGDPGQLTSPPVSALALRDSLMASDPQAWRAPLGTIDVLISPHPDVPDVAGDGTVFTEPTMANIKRAFDAWWDRCDRDAGNVAIFYFCGHGIEGDEQYLLASDFGATRRRPWEGAIAIDSTIKGLWFNKAETQCVFVDACREVTPATRSPFKNGAQALAWFDETGQPHVRYNLDLKAVARDQRALAPPNNPAYFTAALVAALEGAVAEEDDDTGEWVVTTGGLATTFFDVLKAAAPHRIGTPQPRPGPQTVLYRPPRPPTVALTVDCNPEDALDTARMACVPQGGGQPYQRLIPERAPWSLPVAAGYYTVSASFGSDSQYSDSELPVLARPPARRRVLRV
ncbi:MAG: caspase family protein [Acidimicrobiia bacterium]|nr:caspase family protein [Acidimicrobiia bacterium]